MDGRCGLGKRKMSDGSLKKRTCFFLFLLVWCMQMLTAVYFCCQKQGFHEDEFYTYYSTARTNGLLIEDGAWMERDAYFNEFVVLEGQGFQYGLVKMVQSWDVHPPVYYWVFHTVCSFFPGQFSKWFGLGINLAAFGLSLFLLYALSVKVTGGSEKRSLLVCLFYGFTPAAMSGVVFIRMYALLTVFVYLCAILHVDAVNKREKKSAPGTGRPDKLSFGTFLLPLMIVTYLGFLTQYYYFIFLFFMAFAFCVYLLWRDRNLWNCIRYGASLAAAFISAYLTYPSCLGQMFRGQRGAQAAGNFFDLSNTMPRIAFFWELMDEYVFGKMLFPLLLLLLLLILTAYGIRKRKHYVGVREGKEEEKWPGLFADIREGWKNNVVWWMLFVAVTGYFLAVSKTALLLGNTSIRYQLPVYGMAVLLLFEAVWGIGKGFLTGRKTVLYAVSAALGLFISLSGLFAGRVVFLYPEAAGRVAFAREKAEQGVPVICLYDAGQNWCVWDCADEFFAYDRIYFVSQSDTEPIADAVIADSGELVVYLYNTAEKEAQLQRILDSNPKLSGHELQYREKYCDVYYFYK